MKRKQPAEPAEAGRTCQIESAGIEFVAIAPLILADISKIQQKFRYCYKIYFFKTKTVFYVFKKDIIANKMFFQKIYRLHVFWLTCVVLPRQKINQK